MSQGFWHMSRRLAYESGGEFAPCTEGLHMHLRPGACVGVLRCLRYRETCLALESVAESSAAVSKPRCVWLRVLVVYDLKEAVRLPTRVQE